MSSVEYQDCVELSDERVCGKQKEPLCFYLDKKGLRGNISSILSGTEEVVMEASRKCFPKQKPPNQQSLRNLRGSWFETIVKYVSWEVSSVSDKLLAIPMPNARAIQFWELFNENVKERLDALFDELSEKGINLTLSNPDILFIYKERADLSNYSLDSKPLIFSIEDLDRLDRAYEGLRGACDFNAFAFGAAVKTELRPDRRYQIIYEGAVFKAIISHLKQRFWDREYDVKYYGVVNSPPTKSDLHVLTNPSIDSLTSVYVEPRKAVDDIISCNTVDDLRKTVSSWVSIS